MVRRRRLFLLLWHAEEYAERARSLRAMGYEVAGASEGGGTGLRALDAFAPDALVIDLGRLPSHGREVALAVRQRKKTRGLPLVFVGGAVDKVARLREMLPDATYAHWDGLGPALARAIARPRRDPVVPPAPASTSPAGYSGTPLPKKLGIAANGTVVVLGAPADFAATLGELPHGVTLATRARAGANVIVVFARRAADLRKRVPRSIDDLAPGGSLWVAWPKQAAVKRDSSLADTDLDEGRVRAIGLDAGVVDTKVCAIDATWSGLRFQRRKT